MIIFAYAAPAESNPLAILPRETGGTLRAFLFWPLAGIDLLFFLAILLVLVDGVICGLIEKAVSALKTPAVGHIWWLFYFLDLFLEVTNPTSPCSYTLTL